MVGQLFLVQCRVGSIPTIPEKSREIQRIWKEKKKRRNQMLTNRVTKRKRGYEAKKGWIQIPYTTGHVVELIELRCKEGYLLGWEKETGGLKVYLRYTLEGAPSRSSIKRRWKPSRAVGVDARYRWGVNGEVGRYILQTSKGRMTSVEARKSKVGGIVWRWVR